MECIVINDDNLKDEEIDIRVNKVRAILLDEDKILASNYSGVILLPGGKVDENEEDDVALIRELKEETGIEYNINDFKEVLLLKHYQRNYPSSDNIILNRLITTKFFLGKNKGIDLNNIKRTKSEEKGEFYTELMDISELLNSSIENPRKEVFDVENKEVIKLLSKIKGT